MCTMGQVTTKGSMLIWHYHQCRDWDEKQDEEPHYCAFITAQITDTLEYWSYCRIKLFNLYILHNLSI